MKRFILIYLFILSFPLYPADEGYRGIFYLNVPFANIHQNGSRYSNVLTTISCNHPVKVYESSVKTQAITENIPEAWIKISTAGYNGFLVETFLSPKKVECLQDKNPKFLEKLNLELSEMYYWGRLYDMYNIGKSSVKQ